MKHLQDKLKAQLTIGSTGSPINLAPGEPQRSTVQKAKQGGGNEDNR
jgi:hypothetical protein